MKLKTQINPEEINSLASMSLQDSQMKANTLLDQCKFKNIAKKFQLIEDISVARRPSEVCRIMYYTYLAGEGLSVIDSSWQKKYA